MHAILNRSKLSKESEPADPGIRIPRVVTDVCGARPVHLAIIDAVTTISGGEGRWMDTMKFIQPGVLVAGLNPVSADAARHKTLRQLREPPSSGRAGRLRRGRPFANRGLRPAASEGPLPLSADGAGGERVEEGMTGTRACRAPIHGKAQAGWAGAVRSRTPVRRGICGHSCYPKLPQIPGFRPEKPL
jgi:hypothetical protein